MLVRKGLVDFNLVENLFSTRIIWWWERMRSWYSREREITGDPELYSSTEYLYDEMMKRRELRDVKTGVPDTFLEYVRDK